MNQHHQHHQHYHQSCSIQIEERRLVLEYKKVLLFSTMYTYGTNTNSNSSFSNTSMSRNIHMTMSRNKPQPQPQSQSPSVSLATASTSQSSSSSSTSTRSPFFAPKPPQKQLVTTPNGMLTRIQDAKDEKDRESKLSILGAAFNLSNNIVGAPVNLPHLNLLEVAQVKV